MVEIKFDEIQKQSIAYDNDKKVGECDYEENDDTWNIVHTSVSVDYQGQGIARKLVECVIENAQKQNKKIVADCGYANRVLNT